MKYIYLFYGESVSSVYGIGTYINQLTDCLKSKKDVKLFKIILNSQEKEFIIKKSNGFKTLCFPTININDNEGISVYMRNVWYILQTEIRITNSDRHIFHFNYYSEYHLMKFVKEQYPKCKIVFTIHYQNWCFLLKGNVSYFKNIIHQKSNKFLNEKERTIFDIYIKEKLLFEEVDQVICLAVFTKELLIEEYKISKEKIAIIYNGLKDEGSVTTFDKYIKIKKKFLFLKNDKIILYVGRLDEIKGLSCLINSFKKITNKFPNSYLVIVGDGDYSTCFQLSKDYWKKIIFTGRLAKDELYNFYQIADVGILPSMHEQCSYVVIEMMMFGVPMIVSTTTGLNEMVIPGVNGDIVPAEENGPNVSISEKEIIEKMTCSLRDDTPEKLHSKQSCRSIYLERYTLESMQQKYLDLYNAL